MSKLKIVLDTNVILSAIFPTSPYQPILRALANEVYELHIATSILLEYEEKINDIFGQRAAKSFTDFLQTIAQCQIIRSLF
jgi:predicted nucleic acid-binding protein